MRTSSFSILRGPETIVLGAGHTPGGGATHGGAAEGSQTVTLTNLIAANLRAKSLNIEILPHSLELTASIDAINARYGLGDAWALEIHRDSGNVSGARASKQCGVYHGPSQGSTSVARYMRDIFRREGAFPDSWARPHTASNHGGLAWITSARPLSHLLELGFVQGDGSSAHLQWLAKVASVAIYEAFTGHSYHGSPTNPDQPNRLIKDTAALYGPLDLEPIFANLGIDVHFGFHPYLKEASLAQWIVESGRGTSVLATQHNNLAGLKFRPEMQGFATPIQYQAHDGLDTYCKFDSLTAFIKGYWRFLTRTPYQGWEEHVESPQEFITFLKSRGFAVDNDYVNKVVRLLPDAERLLWG